MHIERGVVGALAIAFAISATGCGSSSEDTATAGAGGTQGVDPCPTGDVGAWRAMAASPLGPDEAQNVTATWNGSRLLLFPSFDPTSADSAYDPCSDSWQALATDRPPFLNARKGLLGSRFAVVGLSYFSNPIPAVGAWLDAAGTHWTAMNMTGSPLGDDAADTRFAKDTILTFSQPASGIAYDNGNRYDLVSDHWRKISAPTNLSQRTSQVEALVGERLVVWGGAPSDGSSDALGDGAVYDLATDHWKSTSQSAAPAPRLGPVSVLAGGKLVIFGGYANAADQSARQNALHDGAIYDPSADTWRAISAQGSPDPYEVSAQALWTGDRLVIMGWSFSGSTPSGAIYDPATDSWTAMHVDGAPNVDEIGTAKGPYVTPTGKLVLYVESYDTGAGPTPSVRELDPVANAWSTIIASGQPTRRSLVTAWTGSRLIVWGGVESESTGCGSPPTAGCDPLLVSTYFTDGAIFRAE